MIDRKILYLVVLLIASVGCKHEIPVQEEEETPFIPPVLISECDPDSVYFQQEILPLFQSSCAIPGCHDAVSSEDGITLDSFTNIMNSNEITPGDLDDGDIYEVITETDPDKIMPPPPNEPLSDAQIDMIAAWILQGATNNSCTSMECDSLNVTFSGTISLLIENKCEGCHNSNNPSAGLPLTNYDQIEAIASSGDLINSVLGINGAELMPYNGSSLSSCEIAQIEIWINNGAPND